MTPSSGSPDGMTPHEEARGAIGDALRALDAGLPGEAWAALEAAQRSLEAEDHAQGEDAEAVAQAYSYYSRGDRG